MEGMRGGHNGEYLGRKGKCEEREERKGMKRKRWSVQKSGTRNIKKREGERNNGREELR